jgi:hypothetical protein
VHDVGYEQDVLGFLEPPRKPPRKPRYRVFRGATSLVATSASLAIAELVLLCSAPHSLFSHRAPSLSSGVNNDVKILRASTDDHNALASGWIHRKYPLLVDSEATTVLPLPSCPETRLDSSSSLSCAVVRQLRVTTTHLSIIADYDAEDREWVEFLEVRLSVCQIWLKQSQCCNDMDELVTP